MQIKAEARLELRRRFGDETLGKMDLVDLMDLMDMPQWQQTNRHGTHAVMAAGNTRLVCERPSLIPGAKHRTITLAEAIKLYTMPAVINRSLPKGGGQEGEENC